MDYDDELWEIGRKAKDVAQLIDFSLRFEPCPKKPKQTGGITMAKTIATTRARGRPGVVKEPGTHASTAYFKIRRSKRTLQTYWKWFEPVAAFLPLIFFKKYPAWPLRVSGTKFAEKLLARLDDKDTLSDFFAEYNANVARLRTRRYSLHSLEGFQTSEITFAPLPEDVMNEVRAYRS